MGVSASSLLDESKSNYIKDSTQSQLKEFSPYYRKQFSVSRFAQVEDELEQHKEKITQLLQQREAPKEGAVLYEEAVLYFDDSRKWKERYVVVRANYCLECHDSLETFVKGVPPAQKLLPTGGTVLTTEEKYMAMVDKCFPDDSNVKEDFAPPLSGMPGQFPVYLRLPYRRDSYFCFKQQAKQDSFLSILSDCIRHQNQDFLKKKTCEVQAFLKAIQLYRQDKGQYESWNMLMGSDVRVLANLVMEQLLPSLEKDMLPRLKAKKTEKKRVWFATVEAAYILVQENLLEGLSALKEECRTSVRQQEVLIHSDMDPIRESRRQLEENLRTKVSEAAEKVCQESVQPYLGSVLEELMEPISSGFQDGRQLSESMMDQVCEDVQQGGGDELKKTLASMARPNLQSCYQKIGSLQEKLQHLQGRFGFSNITGLIHSAQIDLQQLMENAAYTFEQLFDKALQDNPDNPSSAVEKVKLRVLKQYDYDSSSVRKRTFQEAVVSITLPFIKKNLESSCKPELQSLENSVYTDHANFIHVENVYESILLQTLDKETNKVVKEAASLKKYGLFTDSRDLLSPSSRSSLSSPSASTPGSPTLTPPSQTPAPSSVSQTAASVPDSPAPSPPSPLAVNGLSSSPKQEVRDSEPAPATIQTPLGEVELGGGHQVAEPPATQPEVGSQGAPAVASAESHSEDVNGAKETATEEAKAACTQTEISEGQQEAEGHVPDQAAVVESLETEAAAAAAQPEDAAKPQDAVEPVDAAKSGDAAEPEDAAKSGDAVEPEDAAKSGDAAEPEDAAKPEDTENDAAKSDAAKSGDAAGAEDATQLEGPGKSEDAVEPEDAAEPPESTKSQEAAPSAGETVVLPPAEMAEAASVSDSSAVSIIPETAPSVVELAPEVVSSSVEAGAPAEAGGSPPSSDHPASLPTVESAAAPGTPPPDSVKQIRDLVVEVIEVEELVQRYPSGVPKEEEEEEQEEEAKKEE